MLKELDHVVMAVRDMAACLALYGGELELAELGRGEGDDGSEVCMLGIGPSILELRQDAVASTAGEASASTRPVVDHFALLVENMDETYAVLKDRNIDFANEPASTDIGHRNMQRTLAMFVDPTGFHVQLSETIDPRPHLDERKAAKRRMAGVAPGLFGGIDHISTYCADFGRTRAFFHETLGLEEFFHSTTREAGLEVEAGFAQSAFAIGGTDIELATYAAGTSIGAGTVVQLGFRTDDIDRAYQTLQQSGVALDGPPAESAPLADMRRSTFALHSPDGLRIQIAQTL